MSAPAACVHCTRTLQSVLVCESCRRVQPLPPDADAFAILGMPRKLAVCPITLEARFHAMSRLLHPDRFHASPPLEKARSEAAAAALNRSHKTLRDPLTRGRYWLELGGANLGDNHKAISPELAEAVFEIQESIEQAQQASSTADRVAARGTLKGFRRDLAVKIAASAAAIDRLYAEADCAGPDDAALRVRLQKALSEHNYLNRQVVNIDAVLEE